MIFYSQNKARFLVKMETVSYVHLVWSNYSKLLVKKKLDFQKINEYSLKYTRNNTDHPKLAPYSMEAFWASSGNNEYTRLEFNKKCITI